jgi:hypothetical protein
VQSGIVPLPKHCTVQQVALWLVVFLPELIALSPQNGQRSSSFEPRHRFISSCVIIKSELSVLGVMLFISYFGRDTPTAQQGAGAKMRIGPLIVYYQGFCASGSAIRWAEKHSRKRYPVIVSPSLCIGMA